MTCTSIDDKGSPAKSGLSINVNEIHGSLSIKVLSRRVALGRNTQWKSVGKVP